MSIYNTLERAYRRSCPIVSIDTADCASTIEQVVGVVGRVKTSGDSAVNGKHVPPVVSWDCVDGIRGHNDAGRKIQQENRSEIYSVEDLLTFADDLPEWSVVIVINAHRFLDSLSEMQAVWNRRDKWKQFGRMLILIGYHVSVPPELTHDVIQLDEPLPDETELKRIVGQMYEAAGAEVDDAEIDKSVQALRGVSAFAAEQISAINIRKSGMDVGGMWTSKRKKIDDTPGLRVVSDGSFDDIAGVDQAKKFLRQILGGKERPNAIVFVDEIEKAIGGSGSDTSGVSQDQLGVLLTWMQDHRASGMILVGPPGAAKSAMAKSAGGEANVPTVQLDLGGMKGSLVGESESRIRDALKVVDGISGGRTLWLATCNSLGGLPPELKRRFQFGTWFFDLPDRNERAAIWRLYCDRHGHDFDDVDDLLDREWTGAEIESCCLIAYRTGTSLQEAAAYIVPVSQSAADQIKHLRQSASGKMLSAHKPGVYSMAEPAKSQPRKVRQLVD